ncbi:hypothetical protein Tco_0589193, partial [Tanacetum coccineum]
MPWLVPSCFVIFDLEPLTLSLDNILMYEIFKSFSFRLDRLFRLTILCLDQHAHTLHHLESLLTISLDRLDILKEDLFEHEHVVVNPTPAGMRHHHLHLYMNPEIKQLAIKRVDEYGFVIRPDLVRLTFGFVGLFYSLTGFPAQSVRSSNADALDSPYLLVLITGASQSRQHVDTSLIHIESHKSPTKSLFDAGSSRISIFTVNTLVSLGCSGKITRIMRRTLVNSLKRISDKRTKNQAKTDKTKHGMEKHGKDKVKSKPKSTKAKVNPDKVKAKKSS